MDENIRRLANIINDYELFPKAINDAFGEQRLILLYEHIRRWLGQFDENDQAFVLQHTVNLMSKNYYSKNRYIELIKTIASSEINQEIFRNGCLLDIQKRGDSQKNINTLLQYYLKKNHNIDVPIYKRGLGYKNLIYFDDFSFSGDRIYRDVKNFLDDNKQILQGRNIYIWVFLNHTYSQWQLPEKLNNLLVDAPNNQSLFHFSNFEDHSFGWGLINNSFIYGKSYLSEVYFPEEDMIEIPQRFLSEGFYQPGFFRKGNHEGCLLGNDVDRRRIEKIFTDKGFHILSYSKELTKEMKPLGYSRFNGFGFGGNIFSYRNCPNNTPLVFWWGDYEENDNSATGCWYPLMKRTTYDE